MQTVEARLEAIEARMSLLEKEIVSLKPSSLEHYAQPLVFNSDGSGEKERDTVNPKVNADPAHPAG
jgi:hypothetical protein